jgi:hypothetical protein
MARPVYFQQEYLVTVGTAVECTEVDSCTAANRIVYSMTSSARASRVGGTSRPSAFATIRLSGHAAFRSAA